METMKKLIILFFLLLLLGVIAEQAQAQESVVNKPFCYTEKGLRHLVDVINRTDNDDEVQKALEADCQYEPVLAILGKTVDTLQLRGRMFNVREVLVLGFAMGEVILMLPIPVVMYGTFPIDGKEA